MADAVRLQLAAWEEVREAAARIRFIVFVEEQKVPAEIELDEWDAQSLHVLAFGADGTAIATGRLLPDGHIGRMAVLPAARGSGTGTAMLVALMQAARERGQDRKSVV